MLNLPLNKGEKIAFIGDLHLDSQTPQSRTDDILQTTLEKLDSILGTCKEENVKYLFWAGDLVNRISLPFAPVNSFMQSLLSFREAGVQCFSICGNHDLLRNSIELIDRSPIQTLFSSGLITHINLDNSVCINGEVLITPLDYTETPLPSNDNYKYNILLCHAFINANEFMADEKHNITTKDILDWGYDVVIAGHDHQYYPPEKVGKTLVYRPGSVLRGTAHEYNFSRKPQFIVFDDISDINQRTIKEVIIKHRPYEDVVSQYILNKKNDTSLSGLKDVLSNLADKLAVSAEDDGDRILERIKTDPELPNDSRVKLLHYISEA